MSDYTRAGAPQRDSLLARIAAVLDQHVRPELAIDGAGVELVGLDDEDIVQVRLLGSCQGCSNTTYAMTMRVESVLKVHVPEVRMIEAVP